MVETSSDKITFRIPLYINDGVPLQSSQPVYHVDCFRRKAPPSISSRIPNADPTRGAVNLGLGGLEVDGVVSRRLVYKEVVEV